MQHNHIETINKEILNIESAIRIHDMSCLNQDGVPVINDPDHLAGNLEKYFLTHLSKIDLVNDVEYFNHKRNIENWDVSLDVNSEFVILNTTHHKGMSNVEIFKKRLETIGYATQKCGFIQTILLNVLRIERENQLIRKYNSLSQSKDDNKTRKLMLCKITQMLAKDKHTKSFNKSIIADNGILNRDVKQLISKAYHSLHSAALEEFRHLFMQLQKLNDKSLAINSNQFLDIKNTDFDDNLNHKAFDSANYNNPDKKTQAVLDKLNVVARLLYSLQIPPAKTGETNTSPTFNDYHQAIIRSKKTFLSPQGQNTERDIDLLEPDHSKTKENLIKGFYIAISAIVIGLPVAIAKLIHSQVTRGHYQFWKPCEYDTKNAAKISFTSAGINISHLPKNI